MSEALPSCDGAWSSQPTDPANVKISVGTANAASEPLNVIQSFLQNTPLDVLVF
jgi:hypothetical protein